MKEEEEREGRRGEWKVERDKGGRWSGLRERSQEKIDERDCE